MRGYVPTTNFNVETSYQGIQQMEITPLTNAYKHNAVCFIKSWLRVP